VCFACCRGEDRAYWPNQAVRGGAGGGDRKGGRGHLALSRKEGRALFGLTRQSGEESILPIQAEGVGDFCLTRSKRGSILPVDAEKEE
jgi:hypothetical protein